MSTGEGPGASWLTLGTAAALLGVSESTIRRWADAGQIRSFRTRGGHRRVLEEDLQHLVLGSATSPRDAGHISDIAIARVRRRLSRGPQDRSTVLASFSEETRARLRLLGRQLVDLFARYIAGGSRRERFSEDARVIGKEYGRLMVAEKVRLTIAIATFNSLRRSLEETASQITTEAGLGVEDAVEAVEQILALADIVLEGMAEEYEAAASGSRRA
jgi:excisionase family DNA binding protein